ncbi:hypothetical protein [Terrarubrum flagellatum]|uniref:hypothetical protein n=1 Tax=Terrirubrum flagellatum TaxID=2895980 RepID=UPI0031450CA2
MTVISFSRRKAMVGAAALAATPAAARLQSTTAQQTPIARLWAEIEEADLALAPHRAAIAAAETLRHNAAPGWMYLSGKGREIGEQRYQALIATLRETPRSANDIALMAQAARHPDIASGPLSWAGARVAEAASRFAA